MSYNENYESVSVEASADLSTKQYLFVYLDSSKQAAVCGANVDAFGVLMDKPAAQGRAGEVAVRGTVKVIAGAAVAAGAKVESDASGRAITSTGSGSYVLGTAREAATAAGDLIAVELGSKHILA